VSEAATVSATAAPVDGRTARRDRNRLAVLDAVIELFREDNLRPSPEEVAKRSGVSLRSVYRYYSEPPELLRAAMARHLERVGDLREIERIGEGDFDDRVERFVDARVRLHEAIGPAARAARVASIHNDVLREQYESTRRLFRQQVDRHFALELDSFDPATRRALSAAVDALVQLDALDYFRVNRKMSKPETARTLVTSIKRLLGSLGT